MFPTFYIPGDASDPYLDDVTLLLHGDGTHGSQAIVDSSLYNHPITVVGNTHISNVQSKFGGTSLAFDGLGDYIYMPDSAAWNFLAGDFTIELWAWATEIRHYVGLQYPNLFGQRSNLGSNESFYCYVYGNVNPSRINFTYSDGVSTEGPSIAYEWPLNVWKHLAFSRNGPTLGVFIDGTRIGTYNMGTDSLRDSTQNFYVGALPPTYQETYWKGYIDELRITRGIGRYPNSTFPLQTARFPDP